MDDRGLIKDSLIEDIGTNTYNSVGFVNRDYIFHNLRKSLEVINVINPTLESKSSLFDYALRLILELKLNNEVIQETTKSGKKGGVFSTIK